MIPTCRYSQNNVTGWIERGLSVHFSLSDLSAQAWLSSDQLFPWKRVTEGVLKIARDNRQTYIFIWFPYRFGAEAAAADTDKHRHQNIIQQVVPTRTGFNGIKSDTVVWMSAVNSSAPRKVETVRQKPWTDDDHWTKYTSQSTANIDTNANQISKINTVDL